MTISKLFHIYIWKITQKRQNSEYVERRATHMYHLLCDRNSQLASQPFPQDEGKKQVPPKGLKTITCFQDLQETDLIDSEANLLQFAQAGSNNYRVILLDLPLDKTDTLVRIWVPPRYHKASNMHLAASPYTISLTSLLTVHTTGLALQGNELCYIRKNDSPHASPIQNRFNKSQPWRHVFQIYSKLTTLYEQKVSFKGSVSSTDPSRTAPWMYSSK